jgi:hypothetical protein
VHSVGGEYVAVGVVPGSGDRDVVSGSSWVYTETAGWHALEPFGDQFSDVTASAAGPAGVVVFTVTQSASDISATSTPAAWYAPVEAFLGR